ncbi:uncharacterized protein LOC108095624 isoform X3 [Drosophila ficusphila]|uniref:uncharacterized protein LOC108095624 isoform X3 n=1 Tax=Drosophila ficusphila TaxID=30025 RepID=UPI0007E82165|nr:uncharacterized protein LOC108095624 isoform X3 [Drosophila ficusphila]
MSSMGANNLYDESEIMVEFISCYRHFTALWDSRSADYLSKQKKDPGYQELLKILRRVNGGCSLQDVKRKINSLRCCYRREIKKVHASSDIGYKPRLWWFHLMEFLNPVLNIKPTIGVKSESMDDSLDEASINDDDMYSEPFHTEDDGLRIGAEPEGEPEPELDQEPEPETVDLKVEITPDDYQLEKSDSPGRERTSEERRIYYREPARKRRRDETPIPERDMDDRDRERETEIECDLIGKRMATHFRQMKPDQRLFAERIISEVLVYGRMDRLSFEARFVP